MNSASEWPLVSVVLAVRNGERFLAEAIRSVLAQDYPHYELIVVDGHSTDGTGQIAQSFSGVRFLPQQGHGLPAGMNFGIAQARGDWVAMLDHDDLWAPEKLRTQVRFMLQRPELQFTMSHARFFLEPGCEWPASYNPEWFKKPQIGSILSSFLARKSVFDQVGLFDVRMKCAGDMDWFSRAKDKQIPMAYLNEALVLKRVHESNFTHQVQLNNVELLQIIKRTLDRKRATQLASPAFDVSVVIPAFNAARHLGEAIESVLAQTVRPTEIIVVDDGSTDDTKKIAESFGGAVVCHHKQHSGIAATRNFGIRVALGNWLAFLDADDLWTREKLEWQLAAAKKNDALEIIFGGTRQFVSPELTPEDQLRLAAPLETSAAPHVGTMLARRAIFDRLGLFDSSLKMGEFIDWYARARDAGVPMTTLPEIILRRRRHPANTTLLQKDSLTDLAVAMKRILDRRRQSTASIQP